MKDALQFLIAYLTSLLAKCEDRNLGATRSPQWEKLRKQFLKTQSSCQVCSTTKNLEVHHIIPFHVDASKELDMDNLITLCNDHHLLFGHLMSYRSFNGYVKDDAQAFNQRIQYRP